MRERYGPAARFTACLDAPTAAPCVQVILPPSPAALSPSLLLFAPLCYTIHHWPRHMSWLILSLSASSFHAAPHHWGTQGCRLPSIVGCPVLLCLQGKLEGRGTWSLQPEPSLGMFGARSTSARVGLGVASGRKVCGAWRPWQGLYDIVCRALQSMGPEAVTLICPY